MTSIALQYGVPLKALVDKFSHTRFEPSGFTPNPEIPFAKSVTDYVFRWLGINFPGPEPVAEAAVAESSESEPAGERVVPIRGGSATDRLYVGQDDAPFCPTCSSAMIRAGACYNCLNCGETSSCG